MEFEFATATRIVFGPGTLKHVGPAAAGMGSRGLVVTGAATERAALVLDHLAAAAVSAATYRVAEEPTIDVIARGVERAVREQCDLVIGCGGGSALDAGKAIAALISNGGEPLDYLEVIGRGRPITRPSVPFIAIPTTAGTGAEVTRNAVLGSPEHHVKVSLRSPHMLPRLAIVDPVLTCDLPPSITASTGLDALTQLLEPFVSRKANPLTDAVCRGGLQRVASSLRRAFQCGADISAREDMSLASLFGGLALANAKLGAVHGIAGPFGGMFPAPHGATCAALLPHVTAVNLAALRARCPESPALARYQEAARILTGDGQADAGDGVAWIEDLVNALEIPPLGRYGLSEADFPTLIEQAARASSMQGNPVQLTDGEMTEILHRSL